MTQEFRLPDIGEGLTEAEVVRWLIAEGEFVGADQPVVEVETDKAVVEIPSPYSGVLLKHGAAEGETIEVGEILIVVGDEGDGDASSTSDEVESSSQGEAEQSTSDHIDTETTVDPEIVNAPDTAAPIVGTLDEVAEDLSLIETAGPDEGEGQVKALPLVRKLAREMGVDLAAVRGSGPGGRIVREDVLAAAQQSSVTVPTGLPTVEPAPASAGAVEGTPAAVPLPPPAATATADAPRSDSAGRDRREPMTRLRRTIASNMSRSWSEIPHVTTFDEVDATRLLEVRSALSSRHESKVPLDALVVKAVIGALESFPEFNATLDGDDLVIHGSHNVGIAVDTPDGLLVAVIRDAGSRGVIDLANEVRRLGDGARTRSLAPEELSGQSFTVSNIGAVGGGHGTPIVPYGTTAILSVGRAQQKPLVVQGELVIAPVMPLSLSYDHRVIDGGQGRRFMAQVIENLEEPALFLAN